MTRKVSERLSVPQVQAYIDGVSDPFDGTLYSDENKPGSLVTELYAMQQKSGMKPRCIVEYDRCAFVEDVGNVRITFDMNVRGSAEVDRFFDMSSDFMLPAIEPGYHVLEVKFDEFLPTYLRELVDLNDLHRQSVSKYALVREAIVKGGHYYL